MDVKGFWAVILSFFLILPVSAESPCVALTFDDGPSGRFTRQLLDGLAEREVHATFLLCGYRMQEAPELVRRIAAEGHEIGLHGFSHRSMGKMGKAEVLSELQKTAALLPEGVTCRFLRPPGGITTPQVRSAAEEMGLSILSWSVDPRDWATHNASQVEQSVLKSVKDGDIILLHDMTESSVEAALYLVDALQSRGFTILPAGELADRRGAALEPGQVYFKFTG